MVDVLMLAGIDAGFAYQMAAGWYEAARDRLAARNLVAFPEGLVQGLRALEQAEWTAAIDQLRRVADRERPSATQTIVKAWQARAWRGMGQLEMAEEVIRSCLGLPGCDAAVFELAELQAQRGQRRGAIRTLIRERRRLAERHPTGDPAAADAYARYCCLFSHRIAVWWLEEGDATAAMDAWQTARSQVVALPDSYLLEADLFLRRQAIQAALASLLPFALLYRERVLAADPELPGPLVRLQSEPALADLWSSPHLHAATESALAADPLTVGDPLVWQEQLCQLFPDHPEGLLQLGRYWLERYRPDRAAHHLRQAYDLPCANPHVRDGSRRALHSAYARLPGRQEDALALCDGDAPEAALAADLCHRYASEGRWEELLHLADRLGPQHRGALPALLEALASRQDEETLRLLERLAVAIPDAPPLIGELITRYLTAGNMAAVASHVRNLIRANPGFETFAHLARRFWDAGRRDAAEGLLSQFAQSYPGSNAPYWTLAAWWSESGDADGMIQAAEHARQAMKRTGPLAQNQAVLARLARHGGDPRKALQHYRAAMRQSPDDVPLLREVAEFAIGHGFLQEAELAYERLRQLTDTPTEGLLSLAHHLWQGGQHGRAASLYLEAEALGVLDAIGRGRITQWLLARGEWELASERLGGCVEAAEGAAGTVLALLQARLALRRDAPAEALAALETAVGQCEWVRLLLPDDPVWEPLRAHDSLGKRFAGLLY